MFLLLLGGLLALADEPLKPSYTLQVFVVPKAHDIPDASIQDLRAAKASKVPMPDISVTDWEIYDSSVDDFCATVMSSRQTYDTKVSARHSAVIAQGEIDRYRTVDIKGFHENIVQYLDRNRVSNAQLIQIHQEIQEVEFFLMKARDRIAHNQMDLEMFMEDNVALSIEHEQRHCHIYLTSARNDIQEAERVKKNAANNVLVILNVHNIPLEGTLQTLK